jgi:hypothetical protein
MKFLPFQMAFILAHSVYSSFESWDYGEFKGFFLNFEKTWINFA